MRESLESLRRQLAQAQQEGNDRRTLAKISDLEARRKDVEDFDRRLTLLLEGRQREARIWCPWKKPEEQPVGWDPDINDGVRVNVAPVQRLGLLAGDVLAAKDLKSLLAPEGREYDGHDAYQDQGHQLGGTGPEGHSLPAELPA
jgi:hypothetical protein